jgi:hypothetical protein
MNNKIILELIWWTFTAVVTAAVLFPIYASTQHYTFYFTNVLFIVTFITVSRYIFLLKFTFLAHLQILKIAIVFLAVPFIFFLIQELNLFQTFLDEEGAEAMIGRMPFQAQENIISYIRSEMLLFGVGSIISCILLPFRMILSVWRVRNRGTV